MYTAPVGKHWQRARTKKQKGKFCICPFAWTAFSGKRTNTKLPGNTLDQNTCINYHILVRQCDILAFTRVMIGSKFWTDHRLGRSKLSMRIQASKRTRGPSTVKKLDVNRFKDPTVSSNFNKANWGPRWRLSTPKQTLNLLLLLL